MEVSADNSFPDFRSPFPAPRSPLPVPRFSNIHLHPAPDPRRRVLLGILGGDVVLGSPNPDLIADPKIVIFHTLFQTRSLKSILIFGPGLI